MLWFVCFQLVIPQQVQTNILRLPVLLSHFYHHNKQEGQTGFIDFLASHYLDISHHHPDNDEHENLPFSPHSADLLTFQFVADLFIGKDLSFSQFFISHTPKVAYYRHVQIPSNSFTAIWRPPKLSN